MRPSAIMRGYQHEPNGTFDWTADATQRRVLLAAIKRGVNNTMAFANSSPFWMTISGSVTGAVDGGNNLRDDMYQAFADYLAEVVQHFASDPAYGNVVFKGVTPLNEPVSSWWRYGNFQEGQHFDRDKQAEIVQLLAQALQQRGLWQQTPVAGPEENSIDDALTSLQAYGDQAVSGLRLVTTHSYNGNNRAGLAQFASSHGQTLWHSEYGSGSGALQGGVQIGQKIVLDLNQLNCSIWTLWQAADTDNPVVPSGWGLIDTTFHEMSLYHFRMGNRTGNNCLRAVADDPTGQTWGVHVEKCVSYATPAAGPQQVFSVLDAQLRLFNSSGPCLQQVNSQVRAATCNGSPTQHWVVNLDGTVRLNVSSVNLCLAVNTTGTNLVLMQCPAGSSPAPLTMRWYLTSLADDEMANVGSPPALPEAEDYLVRPQYYAYMQFTRFLVPGTTILTVADASQSTVAGRRPDGRTAVAFVNADGSHSHSVSFQIKSWQGSNTTVEVWQVGCARWREGIIFLFEPLGNVLLSFFMHLSPLFGQTSDSINCSLAGTLQMNPPGTFQTSVPPNSITTFLTW